MNSTLETEKKYVKRKQKCKHKQVSRNVNESNDFWHLHLT